MLFLNSLDEFGTSRFVEHFISNSILRQSQIVVDESVKSSVCY